MWLEERHGALRGLLWTAYLLSALDVTQAAQAAGRSGFQNLDYYSLFDQPGNQWSLWASCASVPNAANKPEEVMFDGVAQIFSHAAFVAFASGHTAVRSLRGLSAECVPHRFRLGPSATCVLGARFSGGERGDDVMLLNVCSNASSVKLAGAGSWLRYDGHDVGGFVKADEIGSLDAPPWTAGPLKVASGKLGATGQLELPPISLTFVQLRRTGQLKTDDARSASASSSVRMLTPDVVDPAHTTMARRVGRLTKGEQPVITMEHPWEKPGLHGGAVYLCGQSVIEVGSELYLYYTIRVASMNGGSLPPGEILCLAVSADSGKTWTKPSLGLVVFNNSKVRLLLRAASEYPSESCRT